MVRISFKMDFIYHIIFLIKRYFGLTNNQHLEDVFYQLLHDRKYDEALNLANLHNYLDRDLVYKCRWRNSSITVHSINNVLGNIQDKLWAINECVQTVPISYDACRTLIEFGLREANLKLLYQLECEQPVKSHSSSPDDKYGGKLKPAKRASSTEKKSLLEDDVRDEDIEGLIDFANLNERQKELGNCRRDLIRHEHSLFAYENILGDYRTVQRHFDHVFYDEFRRKCPLNVCIDYANEGDAHAVEILLNFYSDDLVPHLLTILSNFPETLSPYQYRNLLPCLREGEEVYEWRSMSGKIRREEHGWSGRADNDVSILHRQPTQLTFSDLCEWFVERALDMERRTLLNEPAIQLLRLGNELNLRNLNKIQNDLINFDKIIDDCQTESNMFLSFSQFLSGSYEACELIIKNSLQEYWSLCYKLGIKGDIPYSEAKYRLLTFALTYCDNVGLSVKILSHIIDLRKRDEKIQLAYLQSNI